MYVGFELCVFVAGWRHALRSEWPFIIIIIIIIMYWNTVLPYCRTTVLKHRNSESTITNALLP